MKNILLLLKFDILQLRRNPNLLIYGLVFFLNSKIFFVLTEEKLSAAGIIIPAYFTIFFIISNNLEQDFRDGFFVQLRLWNLSEFEYIIAKFLLFSSALLPSLIICSQLGYASLDINFETYLYLNFICVLAYLQLIPVLLFARSIASRIYAINGQVISKIIAMPLSIVVFVLFKICIENNAAIPLYLGVALFLMPLNLFFASLSLKTTQ